MANRVTKPRHVLVMLLAIAGTAACGSDDTAQAVDGGAAPFDGSFDASYDGAGLACSDAGTLATMAADPDSGPVDVASYCLTLINGYRAKERLAPYWLQDTSASAMCCAVAEAGQAAVTQGHVNGGCGWQSQGFCGGGRNPDGTVKASLDWCRSCSTRRAPPAGTTRR